MLYWYWNSLISIIISCFIYEVLVNLSLSYLLFFELQALFSNKNIKLKYFETNAKLNNRSTKIIYFSISQKISRILYNETASGFLFENWIPVQSKIVIIEIYSLSQSLLFMYYNNIIWEKGSQKYILFNNTNYYNIALD